MNLRLLYCLCFIVLLSGCVSGTYPAFLTPPDQQLFVQGMEEMAEGRDYKATFAKLQESWPDSPWSRQAGEISSLLERVEKQQKIIDQLRRNKDAERKKNRALRRRIEKLESEREKLRQLLIDLEKRGR